MVTARCRVCSQIVEMEAREADTLLFRHDLACHLKDLTKHFKRDVVHTKADPLLVDVTTHLISFGTLCIQVSVRDISWFRQGSWCEVYIAPFAQKGGSDILADCNVLAIVGGVTYDYHGNFDVDLAEPQRTVGSIFHRGVKSAFIAHGYASHDAEEMAQTMRGETCA